MGRSLERQFERFRRRGDVAALADVFDRTAPEILRVARHFVQDATEADELLQETFLTALASAERYDPSRRLVPWLIGILQNHARNASRKRARRAGAQPQHGRGAVVGIDGSGGPEIRAEVRFALDAMPQPYRAVLVLRLEHGLAPAEIAHSLDRPPATVRSQLQRGLRLMREKLPRSASLGALALGPLAVGIEGVRDVVLAKASALAVAASSVTASALIVGGLTVTKKALILGLVLVCIPIGGFVIHRALERDEVSERDGSSLHADGAGTGEEAAPDASGSGPKLGTAAPTPQEPAPTREPKKPEPPTSRISLDAPIPPGTGSVAGTLRFEDGTPVVGVRLALWGRARVDVVTDEKGFFHLHGERVGDRQLYVKGERKSDCLILRPVSLKVDELVRVDFTIERGHEYRGVVLSARDGAPVVGIRFELRRPGAGSRRVVQGGYAVRRTDEKGRFHFQLLPAGLYTVELHQQGYAPVFDEIEIGPDLAAAEYRLTPSLPFLLQFNGASREAEGTELTWSLQRISGGTRGSARGKSKLAADGSIRMDTPPRGEYSLTVFASKHTIRVERRITVGDDPPDPIVVQLEATARVKGSLRDPNGKPVHPAKIQLGNFPQAEVDEKGGFLFERKALGKHMVGALFKQGMVRLEDVELTSAGTVRLDLVMPGLSTLKGRILAAGASDRGGMLLTKDRRRDLVGMARPDAEGRFEMPYLPAGTYEFALALPGYRSFSRDVKLVAGATLDLGKVVPEAYPAVPVVLTVPQGAKTPRRIRVTVTRPDGPPPRSGHDWPRIEFDPAGKATLTGLLPGSYDLLLQAPDFADVTVTIDVRREGNEPLRVTLQPK